MLVSLMVAVRREGDARARCRGWRWWLMLMVLIVVHQDIAAGEAGLMHPMQGGPYYPDKGMIQGA